MNDYAKQTQSNPISKGAPVLRKRFLQKLLSAVAPVLRLVRRSFSEVGSLGEVGLRRRMRVWFELLLNSPLTKCPFSPRHNTLSAKLFDLV
ncbi:hypothetical protein ES703_92209 [subsurface metagenome]